jgi:hypothetical protein
MGWSFLVALCCIGNEQSTGRRMARRDEETAVLQLAELLTHAHGREAAPKRGPAAQSRKERGQLARALVGRQLAPQQLASFVREQRQVEQSVGRCLVPLGVRARAVAAHAVAGVDVRARLRLLVRVRVASERVGEPAERDRAPRTITSEPGDGQRHGQRHARGTARGMPEAWPEARFVVGRSVLCARAC